MYKEESIANAKVSARHSPAVCVTCARTWRWN